MSRVKQSAQDSSEETSRDKEEQEPDPLRSLSMASLTAHMSLGSRK